LIGRWFDKKQSSSAPAQNPGFSGPRVPRHSGGWAAMRKRLESEPGLRIIDVGYTSPSNINFLADLVPDACNGSWQTGVDDDDKPVYNVSGFLEQALNFSGRMFDVVLLWTALDYLPEQLVLPVVTHLHTSMNLGGQVLAFCHTRTKGEETVFCRYHLTRGNDVEVQLGQNFPIQRAFTNRSIEKLFTGWSGHRQFLAKDSVSEIIMTR
jgi:hypothetical protein